MFVVFEGPAGTSKSTVVHGVAERLRGAKVPVLERQEPSQDMPSGKQFRALFAQKRDIADREAQIAIEDRRDNLMAFVLPALRKGMVVLQSRYYYSTLVYQAGAGREALLAQNRSFCREPDLLIYLTVTEKEAESRLRFRDKTFDAKRWRDSAKAYDTLFHELGTDHVRIDTTGKPALDVIEEAHRLVRERAAELKSV